MKKNIILTLVILTVLFLIFFGSTLILGLWIEFNPNNYKTEEIGKKVKETLQAKYGEKFVVDKTEYIAGIDEFTSKVYPENKRYLNFETVVQGKSKDMREDYQVKKEFDNLYLNKQFSRSQYYYEIDTGLTYPYVPNETKIEELPFQIPIFTVEDKVDNKETFSKVNKLIAELKKDRFTIFEIIFVLVKQPYTLEKVEQEISKSNFWRFLKRDKSEFALTCKYSIDTSSSEKNNLPFSSTCN
ncbi:hypothetical protein ACFVHQ_11980 [Actinomycetes bacterium NPDC127524]